MKQELLPDVFSEVMQPDFIQEEVLHQPETIYRLDRAGHRYYYTFDDKGIPTFYVSATTLIKQTLPTSPHLIDWVASMGKDKSKEYAQDRADYGTFLHMQCGHYMIHGEYNLDTMSDALMDYIEEKKLPDKFVDNLYDLQKDLMAFAQFCDDYDLEPVGIELVLAHPEYKVAGAIDLLAYITIQEKGFFGEVLKSGPNKGKPKETSRNARVLAIIDIKSGKKGFYESSEVQLHLYKSMLEVNYPNVKVDRVFNWSPKEWRSTPSYNFKDQTGSPSAAKLPYLIGLAKIEDAKKSNTFTIITGVIKRGGNFYKNIETKSLSDIVKKKGEL